MFGDIDLRRSLCEAVEAGEPALFPLEQQLGIEAGLATPALAERVGLWSAAHEQEQVRTLLRREHNVSWSVPSLRKVTAALREGLASKWFAKWRRWLRDRQQGVTQVLRSARPQPTVAKPASQRGCRGQQRKKAA